MRLNINAPKDNVHTTGPGKPKKKAKAQPKGPSRKEQVHTANTPQGAHVCGYCKRPGEHTAASCPQKAAVADGTAEKCNAEFEQQGKTCSRCGYPGHRPHHHDAHLHQPKSPSKMLAIEDTKRAAKGDGKGKAKGKGKGKDSKAKGPPPPPPPPPGAP